MVETPRSAATRLIDTACEAVGGRDPHGRGHDPVQAEGGPRPLVRPLRTPQAASMLAGRPVPIWSSIASASAVG